MVLQRLTEVIAENVRLDGTVVAVDPVTFAMPTWLENWSAYNKLQGNP